MLVVYGQDYKSPLLDQLSPDVKVLSVEQFNLQQSTIPANTKVYVTHEEALEAVRPRMAGRANAEAMELFRDKAALRLKLVALFPDFYFKKINLADLLKQIFNFENMAKYIIKPVKGFSGIGVRVISAKTDLQQLQAEIENEIKAQCSEHPEYVKDKSLSMKDFLIEEYIGEDDYDLFCLNNAEIAVDGYYDEGGKFVLLTICHHPYRKDGQYFHLLYYTSQELFDRFAQEVIHFFDDLQTKLKLDLRSFALHAEFRNYKNKLHIIEINPGRFGGTGLGELLFYSFGVNPYELFFTGQSFDWNAQWEKVRQEGRGPFFAWVFAYKGLSFISKISYFKHEKFKEFLGEGLIEYELMNCGNAVASIAYLHKSNKEDLNRILDVEFNDYSFY